MKKSKFLRTLEALAGEEQLELVIPHPLLPPRFLKISRGRNMLLQFNTDLQIFVGWEGARINKWEVLTPRGTSLLIRDVRRKLHQYDLDMGALQQFVQKNANYPIPDPAFEDPSERAIPREAEEADEKKDVEPGSAEVVACEGGESPMPGWDY